MTSTLVRATMQFPIAFVKRSIEAQFEFINHAKEEIEASTLPVIVGLTWLKQLEWYSKCLQFPAVFTGAQEHFKH